MCLGVDLFGFILLGFSQILELVGLYLLQNLGTFQLLLFQIFFMHCTFYNPSGTPPTSVLDCFVIVR